VPYAVNQPSAPPGEAGEDGKVGAPRVSEASHAGEAEVRGVRRSGRGWRYRVVLSAAALAVVIFEVALINRAVASRPEVPVAARPATIRTGGTGVVRLLLSTRHVWAGPSLLEINSVADGVGALWLTAGDTAQNHILYGVNPATFRIDARVELPSRLVINPGDIAAGSGAIWVADGLSLYRVDPVNTQAGGAATRAFAVLPRGGLIGDIVVHAGTVWVTDTTSGKVYGFAADTGRLEAVIKVGATAGAMAVGDRGIWVADADAHTVSRISVAHKRIDSVVRVPGVPDHIAASDSGLWITDGTGNVLTVPAGSRGTVLTVRVGGGPTGVAAVGDTVWIANTATGTVSRIDAHRRAVVATVRVGARPYAIAADGQGAWVTVLGRPAMMHTASASSRSSSTRGLLRWLAALCGVK
jgi:YVTN family beta-propeller protein